MKRTYVARSAVTLDDKELFDTPVVMVPGDTLELTINGHEANAVFTFMDNLWPRLINADKPATWMMCELPTTKEMEHNGK